MLYACAKLSQRSRVLVLIFVNKIFVIGKPLMKITKIFLLENFQLYGTNNKIKLTFLHQMGYACKGEQKTKYNNRVSNLVNETYISANTINGPVFQLWLMGGGVYL